MRTIQRFSITDANGRVANVELTITHNALQFMGEFPRHHERPASSRDNSNSFWRSLSAGAFGAQSGNISVFQAGGDLQAARIYHLQLNAILGGGRNVALLIIKRWFTNNGCELSGTGTLFNGVNLGLQPGEFTWSEASHEREVLSIRASVDGH